MYIVKKLRGHEQANAKILLDTNNHIFYLQSYNTIVLKYKPLEKIIECTGLYSMTTRKHIGWFMREYFGNRYTYHDIKRCYENGQSLVIL